MVSLISHIGRLFDLIESGITSFVDYLMNLPTLVYSLIDVIPEPLSTIFMSFAGLIILVILIKVVSHFA